MTDNEAEFRHFVGAQMEHLRGLAYLTCGDWQAAEDAVLTVLARMYVKWPKITGPVGYARTAVVRAAIDETRRPWWRREHSVSHAMPEPPLPDGTTSIDDRLHLRAALRQLPVKPRAVLVLRFLEGLSVRQTAETLGFPEGTVKVYTARGLETLRRVLGVDLSPDSQEEHHEVRSV